MTSRDKWIAACEAYQDIGRYSPRVAARAYENTREEAERIEELTEKRSDPRFIAIWFAVSVAIALILNVLLYVTLLRRSSHTLLAVGVVITLTLAIGLMAILGFRIFFSKMEEKLENLENRLEAFQDLYPGIGNREKRAEMLGITKAPPIAKPIIQTPHEEDKMEGILVPDAEEEEDEVSVLEAESEAEAMEDVEEIEETDEVEDSIDDDFIANALDKINSELDEEIKSFEDSILNFRIDDDTKEEINEVEDEFSSSDLIYNPEFQTVEEGEGSFDKYRPETLDNVIAILRMLS